MSSRLPCISCKPCCIVSNWLLMLNKNKVFFFRVFHILPPDLWKCWLSYIGGKSIERVSSFRYLGIYLHTCHDISLPRLKPLAHRNPNKPLLILLKQSQHIAVPLWLLEPAFRIQNFRCVMTTALNICVTSTFSPMFISPVNFVLNLQEELLTSLSPRSTMISLSIWVTYSQSL